MTVESRNLSVLAVHLMAGRVDFLALVTLGVASSAFLGMLRVSLVLWRVFVVLGKVLKVCDGVVEER